MRTFTPLLLATCLAPPALAAVTLRLGDGAPIDLTPAQAAAGSTIDIPVYLTREPGDGGSGLSGFQTDFVKTGTPAATLNGPSICLPCVEFDSGTRYESPDWDTNYKTGFALNPLIAAGTLGSVPRGAYGTGWVGGGSGTATLKGRARVSAGSASRSVPANTATR